MCFPKPPKIPSPPPLPIPSPPPEPPAAPLPEPDPLVTEVEPRVRRAESKKKKNPFTRGTRGLRINLDPNINTGNTDSINTGR